MAFRRGVKTSAIANATKHKNTPKIRLFVLDNDQTHIEIYDAKKKHRKETIFLKDVKEIITGDAVAEGRLKKYLANHPQSKALSISVQYGTGKIPCTLDVVCEDEHEYSHWMNMLNYLVRQANIAFDDDPIKMYVCTILTNNPVSYLNNGWPLMQITVEV
jgi:hypothetical protein